ncbi:MAG: chemotaxis protein CheA [Burkholderiaceae bacterium]
MSHDHLLAEARGTFMEESREMLSQFEATLLVLETNPDDAETLNAAFRAAHTIKGSSGLFGFKAVVQFTHEVEAVLDAMRQGLLELTSEAFGVLLQSCDQIVRMLAELGDGAADATPADPALIATLAALHAADSGAHDAPGAGAQDEPTDGPADGSWGVTVRFGPDALRNGFDPVSFIHYLPRIGDVSDLRTFDDAVPALETLDPESCHLGFTLRLRTPGGRPAIEGAFEFAREDCVLELEAPDEDAARRPAPRPTRRGRRSPSPGRLPGRRRRRPRVPPRRRPSRPSGGRRGRRGDDVRTIRVSADKLDRLIDLIGELVIAGSGARLVAEEEGSSKFGEAAQRIAHLVEEARDGALQLRMVQIGETFARFHRVVRDSAKSLGKDIELAISGGDTELDKSMVEMIADPLTHLVRNSVDHGVETAEARVAAGKPARGRVALNAYHDSGSVVVEVTDDGKGLDRSRILAKAIERGLVKEGEHLSDEDIDQLIFAPGFSTAAQVTDISGRGVGMDVVKRNIEALRGTVQLASTPGRGTTTQIRLPLTLAIIDGFLVVVGGAHYIVPLEMVVECIERPSEHALGADGCTGHFELRGQVLPFIDVRAFFGMAAPAAGGRQSLIVVRYGPSKVGLLVDRLMGEYQTVIKPLGKLFQHVRGIAGSTILGSGGVALILDVAALVGIVARGAAARPAVAASARAGAIGG